MWRSTALSPHQLWHLPVDISHPDQRQQETAKEMLYEESAAFARDSNDLRCIPSLQMSPNLKDDIPVQKAYSSVPKPLFKEVNLFTCEFQISLTVRVSCFMHELFYARDVRMHSLFQNVIITQQDS
jgi:hypothetical protein